MFEGWVDEGIVVVELTVGELEVQPETTAIPELTTRTNSILNTPNDFFVNLPSFKNRSWV